MREGWEKAGPKGEEKTQKYNGWELSTLLDYSDIISLSKKVRGNIEAGRQWAFIRNELRACTGLYEGAIWDYEMYGGKVKITLTAKIKSKTPTDLFNGGRTICDKLDDYISSSNWVSS